MYTSILQNLSFIIMVALGKTFNFSIKWLILFAIIGLYVKYELTKRNIISTPNIPYTNKLVDLIQKLDNLNQ